MGAMFTLAAMLVVFGVIYPAVMSVLWLIKRAFGDKESYKHFMNRI